jgi:hypothetical protein
MRNGSGSSAPSSAKEGLIMCAKLPRRRFTQQELLALTMLRAQQDARRIGQENRQRLEELGITPTPELLHQMTLKRLPHCIFAFLIDILPLLVEGAPGESDQASGASE